MKSQGQLHCGACMKEFNCSKELSKHIDLCLEAHAILPLLHDLWNGEDTIGHPLAHFIQLIHLNTHLIEQYAYCIADQVDTFTRSKIHRELCYELKLDYKSFRPFESSEITYIPNRREAKEILLKAIKKESPIKI